MNRRDMLELLAATVGVTLAGTPVLSPAQRLLVLENAASGGAALSLVEAQFSGLMGDYLSTPPRDTLMKVASLQRLIDGVFQLRLMPAESARLWRLAAISAGLRGWVHNNAGDADAARVSLAEAYRRGQLLEDDQIMAWTRYMQAKVEEYAGHTELAEQYALDGLRYAHTGPQRAILLAEPLAVVSARRGDLGGVDRRLGEARDIVLPLSPEDQGPVDCTVVDNLSTYHPIDVATCATTAYACLGLPEKVAAAGTEYAPVIEKSGSYQRPYLRLNEALAVARSKDPDLRRVTELTTAGLNLAIPHQSAHIGTKLRRIVDSTASWRDEPAIRELNERAREWTRAKLPNATL